jgi:hypothetical protein
MDVRVEADKHSVRAEALQYLSAMACSTESRIDDRIIGLDLEEFYRFL